MDVFVPLVERNEYGRCCLIKSANSVLEKLNVYNTTVVRVGGAVRRREMRLVDSAALREAVLNAIIHNDYINGSYPVFEIYDDRIEVISSGGLPIGLSEDEFFKGRSTPRNKELMRVFSDMDMCEQLGSGMKKILKTYPASIFDISEHFISAKFDYEKEALQVLEDQTGGIVGVNVGVNVGVKLSETAQKTIEIISRTPYITALAISEKIGKTKRTVERAIKELTDNGYIKHVGADKSGYYEILKRN